MFTLQATETLICERCGESYAASLEACPYCTLRLPPDAAPPTSSLHRSPTVPPLQTAADAPLAAGTTLLLQTLPGGDCIVVPTDEPVILGREVPTNTTDNARLVALDALNAHQYGVSRQHCLITPAEGKLWVTDLDSTNGTYLNTQRIPPHHSYALQNGDRLILGTLHLLVFGE